MKFLFSSASEQSLLGRGLFVPVGLHLMEGKKVMTNILLEHSDFIKNARGVPSSSLTQKEMLLEMEDGRTVREFILGIKGVASIEKSR